MKPDYIMVDVESDGPIPHDYSMIALGAVFVRDTSIRIKLLLCPISDKWIPDALAVSGFSREETMKFASPLEEMNRFSLWIKENKIGWPVFISDNNGYDWQFVNWYFHHFLGENPFGFSSQNLGSLYKGYKQNMKKNFKHLRKTAHDHDPVNDCIGNIEAMKIFTKHWKF